MSGVTWEAHDITSSLSLSSVSVQIITHIPLYYPFSLLSAGQHGDVGAM